MSRLNCTFSGSGSSRSAADTCEPVNNASNKTHVSRSMKTSLPVEQKGLDVIGKRFNFMDQWRLI
jgi:hypothetical protein